MIRSRKFRICFAFIILISFFCSVFKVENTISNGNTYEINDFEDLSRYASLSRQNGFNEATYVLKNDIVITKEDIDSLSSSDVGFLTFGSSSMPFAGTFDGEGHTIYNLSFSSSLAIKTDTALFSYTDGANIKNLILDNADIQADFRGGIVAGYAINTTFENIIVKNSHLFVAAADNVLTVITDGGIRGGAIAGDAVSCNLYNVESFNNTVNTNNTSGVAALAGKGLTLAGLVGIAKDTEIEYSRVIGGTVKNYYDVVVGAVGGNVLYVGGIVGQMQGTSKVIDSFSTATLYYYCATYVSVGAGNVGHIGGITAKMEGTQNEIIRSHYAGSASSRQYNAALLLPIVQNNQNISGICDIYEGGSVVNVFFKPSLSEGVDMAVLENDLSTSNYGPIENVDYANKDFWKNKSFDMVGNINRSSRYSPNHNNKWVMDMKKGIPVHGKSINATLDFKGAGEVEISESGLVNNTVSTTNPFYFATQGYDIDELTAEVTASENENYKFISWHRERDVFGWEISENSTYLEDIVNNNEVISTKKSDTFSFEDSDLLVAHYKGLVEHKDINGDTIKSKYYNYNDELDEVDPGEGPASDTATFVGWTTEKSDEPGGGYSDISSAKLSNLKSSHKFYEAGDKIQSAMKLYPVYVDLLSNITTVFEGNEQDSIDDKTLRDGVGHITVSLDDDNNIVLNVVGDNNGNLPQGYRFLGWYDRTDTMVSRNQKYVIPNDEIDLSKTHKFTARFEYAVEYYVRAYHQNNGNSFTNSELFETVYYKYNDYYEDITAPGFIRENISHFGSQHVDHGHNDTDIDRYTGQITEPIKVYSHNYSTATGSATAYQVMVDTDFKGSGTIVDLEDSGGASFEFTPKSDRYHLLFWTLERDGGLGTTRWSYGNNPMVTGNLLSTRDYYATAYVVADVYFHDKEDNITSVYRKYLDDAFLSETTTHQYKYYKLSPTVDVTTSSYDAGTIVTKVTLEAAPTRASMHKAGYAFMGFVSSEDIRENSYEWNQLYDVENDPYTSSSVNKTTSYVRDETNKYPITKPVDLYPIYVKYNINTSTNVNLLSEGFNINVPDNPTHVLEDTDDFSRRVTLQADLDTYVQERGSQKYTLKNMSVYKNDELIDIIDGTNGEFEYYITPGDEFNFVANYEPYLITYHTNVGIVDVIIKNDGDELGRHSNPEFAIQNSDDIVFLGWSKTKPQTLEYHYFNNLTNYNNSDINILSDDMIVTQSAELFPVYVKSNIIINSNIDEYIINQGESLEDYRSLINDEDNLTLHIGTNRIGEYGFVGWYKDYVDLDHMGTLVSNKEDYHIYSSGFYDETYTAVYKEIYEIKYYDKNLNLINKVDVDKEIDRTFMQTEDTPEGEITIPIDSEAYQSINETLNSDEVFINWQWVKSDGSIVLFDDFKDEVITESMNLYPIIDTISVEDLSGNMPDVSMGMNKEDLIISFNSLYSDKSISVDVTETSVNPNGNSVAKKDSQKVIIYNNINNEKIAGIGQTNSNGLDTITLMDTITLSVDGNNVDETLVLKLVDENDTVVSRILIRDGEELRVKIPYGNYELELDNSWNYKYSSESEEVIINNTTANDAEISVNKTNNKWLDNTDLKINNYN